MDWEGSEASVGALDFITGSSMNQESYTGAIVSDIIDALPIPMKDTAKLALRKLMEDRQTQAREILIQEIRAGEKDIWEACDVDEVVAIVYRYMRAAQEGTARTNLRLLARIIAGQKAAGALKADEFLYYADIIASLKREEIILLGVLQKHNGTNKPNFQDLAKVIKCVMDELIPDVFASNEEFSATSQALTRTGFVMKTISSTYDCEEPCYLTPLFEKVSKLASFQGLYEQSEQ